MKSFAKIVFVLTLVLALVLGFVYFFFNSKFKDQIIPKTKAYIQEQTKLKIDFKEFRMSFSQLLKLKPSIKITGLTVEDAVKIRLILVQFNFTELLKRKFSIDQILIDGADLTMVENAQREVALKGFKTPSAAEPSLDQSPSLDLLDSLKLHKFQIKNSKLSFVPHGATEAIVFEPVDLDLSDLAVSKDKNIKAKYKLSAKMLGSNRTGITASGELGPIDFSFDSIPLQGSQQLDFYLSDIGEQQRKLILGDLVLVKKQTAVHQESQFSGDLMRKIQGQGHLKLDKLAIGKNDKHKLEVDADLPHSYTLRLLKNPVLKIETTNSSLTLSTQDHASGKLDFNTYVMQDLSTGLLQGSSHGSLTGLELREVLNSVTDYKDLIAGKFSINGYHLSFKGDNAERLASSVKAQGSIMVNNGSLYILKSLTKYKDIASSLIGSNKGGDLLDKVGGEFISLSTDFDLRHGDLFTKPIELKTEALTITGEGMIKQGKDLDYKLSLNVPGLPQVPLGLKGTIDKPKVRPDVAQLGQQQSEKLINGALKMGLDALIRNAK